MSTKQETTARPDPSAASSNPFAGFDPMAAWTASQETFAKMIADAQARAKAFADEYAALEAQMIARAQAAIAAWAQLAQDTLAYGAQLSAHARKVGFEAARKATAGA
jgi:hypothetical protein